jgi:hypothetical protein
MNKLFILLLVFLGLLTPVFFASAAASGYAWSTSAGWINFGCSACNVNVTSSNITGYAWSDNYGWINLNPSTSGIQNNLSGTLSGSAWGENTGWIDFTGAHINCSGKFTGTATGTVVGTVNFDCTNCNAASNWTPTGCGGGGGGGTIICSNDGNCGVNTNTGPLYCQSGNVYQDYITYTCNNPGTTSSSCSNSTAPQLKTTCTSGQICSSGSCVTSPIACTTAGDCGTDNYSGSPFCQSGNVYQDYLSYTCNNPGTISSSCSNSTAPQLKTTCPSGQVCDNGSCVFQTIACVDHDDCGTDSFTGSLFCQGNKHVYQDYITYTCNNPGTASSSCTNVTDPKLKETCSSSEVCDSGSCVNKTIACSAASDCGTNDYFGATSCQGNNVYQEYLTYSCSDPGTSGSSCSNSTAPQLKQTCPSGQNCEGGVCVVQGAGVEEHNECNGSQQCVAVSGAGPNQCQTNNDCAVVTPVPPAPTPGVINIIGGQVVQIVTQPIQTIQNITTAVVQQIPEPIKTAAVETQKAVNTPIGSVATKTASTTGLAVATVAAADAGLSFPFFELFLIPLRLFSLFMTAIGLKKKGAPWGVVYDSVTKQPLDPAYVVLKNLKGEDVSTAITDLDGRFGFLVDPGVYKMVARKTNYKFPSQKLAGTTSDELHKDLYFGENIEIKKAGDTITKNIPLDPIKFDWNEFAKKNKSLMKFYSKWDILIRKIYDYFFYIGFVVAIVAYIMAPYPYNLIIISLYLVMLLLRIFGLKPKTFGYIVDKKTGVPMSYAIVRVILPGVNTVIASKSADRYGKYYCLVSPGKYYVKIEKKNPDGSYSLVHTSPVIDVSKKGIIKEGFKI